MATSKLLPAMQRLHRDGHLPIPMKLICVAKDPEDEIRQRVEDAIREGYKREGYSGNVLERLAQSFNQDLSTQYISGDLIRQNARLPDDRTDHQPYAQIRRAVADFSDARTTFYCSVPPRLYEDIARELFLHDLTNPTSRIVFEKPFGVDEESTKSAMEFLDSMTLQDQTIFVDHYLHKPMVAQIQGLREKYPELDAIWKVPHIQHVQITVAETEGIGDRGEFYESAGALLDMMQNHLFQLLCVTAMKVAQPSKYEMTLFDVIKNLAPETFKRLTDEQVEAAVISVVQKIFEDGLDEATRAAAFEEASDRLFPDPPPQSEQQRSTDAMKTIQYPETPRLSPERWIVRGQYSEYRSELHVADDSDTETFVALQVQLDDSRWRGVPFFLRTGKCMSRRVATIGVHFTNGDRITFRIQPNPQIIVSSEARLSALKLLVADGVAITEEQDVARWVTAKERDDQSYGDSAYDAIVLGCLTRTLEHSVAIDWVTASWEFIAKIQDLWRKDPNKDPNAAPLRLYRSGSNGPDAADRLIRDAGYEWMPLEPKGPLP